MKYSAPYRSVACLAAVLTIASGTLLPAAEPAQCEWVFGAGGADHDKTRRVTFDRDGNVFLASECVGDAVFGDKRHQTAGGMDMCLAKLDPAGRVLWVGSFGGGKTDRAYGVATDATGNAYVTGHFESTDAVVDGKTVPNAGSYDVFTAKFAPDGRLLWVQTAGGSSYDYGHGIAEPRGHVVVTGAVQGPAAFGEASADKSQLFVGTSCGQVVCLRAGEASDPQLISDLPLTDERRYVFWKSFAPLVW